MPRLSALLLSLPALSFLAGAAVAATPEQEVQSYLALLKVEDPRSQATEFEALSGMGLSDPRLFDEVEQRLLADYEGARTDRENRARVAWYFRALGFSGQAKYEATLQRFVEDRTYRNYAVAALRDLPSYAKWNPIIASRASFDPQLNDDENRIRNMLRSDDVRLQRIGAKRAFFTHDKSPAVAGALAERLRSSYRTVSDTEGVETAGWLINALDRATDGRDPLLREIAATPTASYKVQERAKSLLGRRR